ncbi:hypothetical protein [Chryseobacterium wanjuense]
MNNKLSDLQYNPNSSLVKSVEDFYRKPNKTQFEQQIIAKNINDVGNIDAFFAVIYGDRAMRQADFEKAESYYSKAQNFSGIPRTEWNYDEKKVTPLQYAATTYNGFNNILILFSGTTSGKATKAVRMKAWKKKIILAFPFIKPTMNKTGTCGSFNSTEKNRNRKR